MSDIAVKKYFENMPYGDDAKVSEVHGKENQRVINTFVGSLVRGYDAAMKEGDKQKAQLFQKGVNQISKDLENLKNIKSEFAMNYGGGTGGKNQFSNYTDLTWDREFFIENGRINFDNNMRPILTVEGPQGPIVKHIEDITEKWHLKGTFENDYMKMQQDAVKQRNTQGKPLNFDIDWQVSNLLKNEDGWKTAVSDTVGGRYFLNDWMEENKDDLIAGRISDEKLHPDSFNPEQDGRLHRYYADRVRKSFNPEIEREEAQQVKQSQGTKKAFNPPNVGIQRRNNTNA